MTGRVLRLVVSALAVLGILAVPGNAGASILTVWSGFSVADGTQGGVVVSCGATQALGTGYGSFAGPSDFLYLNSLYIADPTSDEVNVYADNITGGSPSVDAIGQLVCDDNAGPGVYRMRQSDFKSVPDASEGGATARCRGGESVVGGAVYNPASFSDQAWWSSTGPVDLDDKDKVPDDGWHGELNNDVDGGGDELLMQVSAFCDTKHNNVGYRSKTTKVSDGGFDGGIVNCNHGRVLIGGGVLSDSAYRHGLYISDTYKDEEAWESRVANWPTPDGKRREITTTAICLG